MYTTMSAIIDMVLTVGCTKIRYMREKHAQTAGCFNIQNMSEVHAKQLGVLKYTRVRNMLKQLGGLKQRT
jgi:hypothetical protein